MDIQRSREYADTIHTFDQNGRRVVVVLCNLIESRTGQVFYSAEKKTVLMAVNRPPLAIGGGAADIAPAWFGGTTNEEGEVYGG